ncbi:glutamate decarboxylase [Sesbania bispinosa]|nr:glutamate decarboxylase [Sesbania bispinosa]
MVNGKEIDSLPAEIMEENIISTQQYVEIQIESCPKIGPNSGQWVPAHNLALVTDQAREHDITSHAAFETTHCVAGPRCETGLLDHGLEARDNATMDQGGTGQSLIEEAQIKTSIGIVLPAHNGENKRHAEWRIWGRASSTKWIWRATGDKSKASVKGRSSAGR